MGLFRNRNSWNKPNNCSFSGYSDSRTGSDMAVINSGPKRKNYLIIPAIPNVIFRVLFAKRRMAGGMRQFFSVAYSKLSSIKKCLSFLKATWSVPRVPEFFRRELVRFIQLGPGATVTLRALFGHRNGGEWIFHEEVEMCSNSLLWQLTENNIGKVKLSIYSFGRPTGSWSKNGSIEHFNSWPLVALGLQQVTYAGKSIFTYSNLRRVHFTPTTSCCGST